MVFPIVFIFAPRPWSVARGRPGSQGLGVAVAATGILATMPHIALQLLGIQPVLTVMVVVGLYTRWFHRIALIIGWAAGMAYGTIQVYRTPGGGQAHFGASATPVFGPAACIAIAALVLNLAVSAVLTVVFRKIGLQDGYDETRPADYLADPVPAPPAAAETRVPRYSATR